MLSDKKRVRTQMTNKYVFVLILLTKKKKTETNKDKKLPKISSLVITTVKSDYSNKAHIDVSLVLLCKYISIRCTHTMHDDVLIHFYNAQTKPFKYRLVSYKA